jgi:WD40 repeat protein
LRIAAVVFLGACAHHAAVAPPPTSVPASQPSSVPAAAPRVTEDRAAGRAALDRGLAAGLDGDAAAASVAFAAAAGAGPNVGAAVYLAAAERRLGRVSDARRDATAAFELAQRVAGAPLAPAPIVSERQLVALAGFSADGERVATVDQLGRAIVWDADTGAERATFQLDVFANEVAVGRDVLVVAGSQIGASSTLVIARGGAVKHIALDAPIMALALDEANQTIALGTDRGVSLRDLDGAARRELELHHVTAGLAFAPDGTLAVGFAPRGLALVDPRTGQARTFDTAFPAGLLSFTGDSARVAAVAGDTAQIFSVSTGAPIGASLTGAVGDLDARISLAGDALVELGKESVQVWRLGDAPRLQTSLLATYGGAISPAGDRLILTGGNAPELALTDGRVIAQLASPTPAIDGLAFAPDGRLAAAAEGGGLVVWSGAGAQVLTDGALGPDRPAWIGGTILAREASGLVRLDPGLGRSLAVPGKAFAATDRLLATVTDKTIDIVDAIDHRPLASLSLPPAPVAAIDLSPDGSLLAAAAGGRVFVYDLDDKSVLRTYDGALAPIAFSADSKDLLAAGDRALRRWSIDENIERPQVGAHRPGAIARAADGAIAVGFEDGSVKILDGATWSAGPDALTAVAFGASATLATGDANGVVRLWKRDGTPIATLLAGGFVLAQRAWGQAGWTPAAGACDWVAFTPSGRLAGTPNAAWWFDWHGGGVSVPGVAGFDAHADAKLLEELFTAP